jgi:hypothetical protein
VQYVDARPVLEADREKEAASQQRQRLPAVVALQEWKLQSATFTDGSADSTAIPPPKVSFVWEKNESCTSRQKVAATANLLTKP